MFYKIKHAYIGNILNCALATEITKFFPFPPSDTFKVTVSVLNYSTINLVPFLDNLRGFSWYWGDRDKETDGRQNNSMSDQLQFGQWLEIDILIGLYLKHYDELHSKGTQHID